MSERMTEHEKLIGVAGMRDAIYAYHSERIKRAEAGDLPFTAGLIVTRDEFLPSLSSLSWQKVLQEYRSINPADLPGSSVDYEWMFEEQRSEAEKKALGEALVREHGKAALMG